MTAKPAAGYQPFTEEEKGAMRRVEGMLAAGTIALGPDPYRRGALSFAAPHIAARWNARPCACQRPGLLKRLWAAVVG
jgi:hypothetical protein